MERFRIMHQGCKVNRYDGEVVSAELRRFGLAEERDDAGTADLVVLNTCAVTDRAVQKGRQALRRLRRENPGARMVVTGCMTPKDQGHYEKIDPGILTVPSGQRPQIRKALEDFLGNAVSVRPEGDLSLDETSFASRTRAFLKVEDGCDAKCSFCIIPSIRGGVKSRPRGAILKEAQELLARGFRELVLCGIHLGHYGRDTGDSVLGLTRALTNLDSDFRVRLSSLEISEVGNELAEVLANNERLAPHLHVPLQSGDDGVLRGMRRPYTVRRFLRQLDVVRQANPDLALTTDVIVGFPGETDAAFKRTLNAVRTAGFSRVHVFPFSPRAGTDAANLPDRVPPAVLRERVNILLEKEGQLREQYDRHLQGTLARVLVETSDEEVSAGLCGRYRRVRLPGGLKTTTFIRCRIVGRAGEDLLGEPCP